MVGQLRLKDAGGVVREIEITRKLSQDSMKAGQQAPFFSLTCPFPPSKEVLAICLGLAHGMCVCV